MQSNAAANSERFPPGEGFLGPATVVEARGRALTLELPDGARVEATAAFAAPYEAAPKDVLLVIGRGSAHYAIGVLHGAGRTDLSFHGDVDLRAIGGKLRIAADQGVEIDAPRLDIRTGKLEMAAGAVVQRCTSLYQRVAELWSVHAKDAHTVVAETSVTQAKSGIILTEETMTINGKQIHLG